MSRRTDREVGIDELLETASANSEKPPVSPVQRLRQVLSAILLVIAAFGAPASITAAWLQTHVLDTDTFVADNADLINDPAVRTMLVTRTGNAMLSKVEIPEAGTLQFRALAALLGLDSSASLQDVHNQVFTITSDAVNAALDADTTQRIWRQVLSDSLTQNLAELRGQSEPHANGALGIQLGGLAEAVRDQLTANRSTLAALLPSGDIDITVAVGPETGIAQASAPVQLIDAAGVPLIIVTALSLVLGVLLAVRDKWLALSRWAAWTVVTLVATFALGRAGTWLTARRLETQLGDASEVIVTRLTEQLLTWLTVGGIAAAVVALVARVIVTIRRHRARARA